MKNLFEQETLVSRKDRLKLKNQNSVVLWFTGLSGSGKSTLASKVNLDLHSRGNNCYMLDGDNIRLGINSDLDFTDKGRKENIRRIAEVAKLFVDAGEIVLCSFVSPFKEDREQARKIIGEENFVEVFVNCPIEECEKRDIKGLYKRARNGEIKHFTGIDSPYEAPTNPEIEVLTHKYSIDECSDVVINNILNKIEFK